jgi:hypothetical protein
MIIKRLVELTSTVQQAANLTVTELDEEIALLDTDTGNYYEMDELGSHIWSRLTKPTMVEELCNQLMSEFGVDADTCRHDTLFFLNQLANEKLLRYSPETVSNQ